MDDALVHAAVGITRDHPALQRFWLVWAEASAPLSLMIIGLLVTGLVWWHTRPTPGRPPESSTPQIRWTARVLTAVVLLILGRGIAEALKQLVRRPRPAVVDPVDSAPGFSFPSGHATFAALSTITVVMLLWPLLSPRQRNLGAAAASLIIILTDLDRVFLGVHYPSDVAAGTVIGASVAALAFYTVRRAERQHAQQHEAD